MNQTLPTVFVLPALVRDLDLRLTCSPSFASRSQSCASCTGPPSWCCCAIWRMRSSTWRAFSGFTRRIVFNRSLASELKMQSSICCSSILACLSCCTWACAAGPDPSGNGKRPRDDRYTMNCVILTDEVTENKPRFFELLCGRRSQIPMYCWIFQNENGSVVVLASPGCTFQRTV